MNESDKIIQLLCTCQPENIALAETIAEGLGIDIPKLLEAEGFLDLEISGVIDFQPNLLKGNFSGLYDMSDFRAIKYFPSLKEVNCSQNSLKYLNGIENLIELETIYCSNNKIVNLNNVKNLFSLKEISCWFNQITDLDALQNLTKLEAIDCRYNQISNLDALQNLPNLTYLNCSNNPIPDSHVQAFREKHPNCKVIF